MTASCSAWLFSTRGAASGATGCPLAVADAACATSAACVSGGGCGARTAGSVVSAGCWAGSSTGRWAAAAGSASPPPPPPVVAIAGGGGARRDRAGCCSHARPVRSALLSLGTGGSAALMRPCVCRATPASPHRAHARQGGAQGEVEADARGPRVRGSGRMRSSSGHMQRRVSCACRTEVVVDGWQPPRLLPTLRALARV